MIVNEVMPMHLSSDGMDAHTWFVFAIVLGPTLLMMVVVAFRVRQDAREEDARDAPSRRE